jgi:GDP-4-dehydro-6-deoxy-D-mannose reductase
MGTIVVTGASGFLGRHLIDALGTGCPVFCIGRRRIEASTFLAADLCDPASIARALDQTRPDLVFHLAGRTPPAGAPDLYRTNTLGTVALLDGLQRLERPVRVVLAGSAAEYGLVPVGRLPVAENESCCPSGPYALSKWFASLAGRQARSPIEVVVARVFNPIGPGMPAAQAFGRFARRLANAGPGPSTWEVGDLRARRDFIDARDVARALIALAEQGRPGQVYNVGTGRSRSIGEGLDNIIRLSGRDVRVESSTDPSRRGPSDSLADITRITTETTWRPTIAFERSLADLWDEVEGRFARAVPPAPHVPVRDVLPARLPGPTCGHDPTLHLG